MAAPSVGELTLPVASTALNAVTAVLRIREVNSLILAPGSFQLPDKRLKGWGLVGLSEDEPRNLPPLR